MKVRYILFSCIALFVITSCKKDATVKEVQEVISTEEKATTDSPISTTIIEEVDQEVLSTKTPIKGSGWYAFINMREPGDIHNYFIRYAEYHFQESRMEFFANMVNSSKMTDYAMREDSVFFVNGPYEDFQFKIMERTESIMKVQAPSGKINTAYKIPKADLQLNRKERIKSAMIRLGKFETDEINARFDSIDSITIN